MIRVILILSLLVGCARHIRVSSKGCQIPAIWSDDPERKSDFKIEHEVYGSTFGQTRINLIEILKNNNYRCTEVATISIKTRQSALDILTGLVPFLSKTTLVVEGTFLNRREDAVESDSYLQERQEFDSEYRRLQRQLRK